MASGDLTASTPVFANTGNIKSTIDALNLATTTDFIMVIPIAGRDGRWLIFKVERAA